jgi:hypothetical protein
MSEEIDTVGRPITEPPHPLPPCLKLTESTWLEGEKPQHKSSEADPWVGSSHFDGGGDGI